MPSFPNPPPRTAQEQERSNITGHIQIFPTFVQEVRAQVKTLDHLKEKLARATPEGVTDLLHALLVSSLSLDASDIHIEPEKQEAKLRLRIDGLLHDLVSLPLSVYEGLLSRIKLTSRLKLNVADKPQDGRFSFSLGNTTVEARVATLPAEYGEAVVLRVLNPKSLMELTELGLRPETLHMLQKELAKPNGMIAATGPTGCGKTTTLYAFLKEIQRPEIKIITIEDPIEYHLEGVSQTQVNPEKGYSFASGLQAIVRQDPDVILVGEIRDKETAQIALQAALTGHLVFSTIHTNDAPGTISRLTSLKASLLNIGAALNVIIGQRLVRKVCSQCTVFLPATPIELAQIKSGLRGLKETPLPPLLSSLKLARPKKCEACNQTGYKGRIGIFEVIIVSSAMEEFILKKPSASALRKFAIQQGMVSMHQDGLLKVVAGLTTLEELIRVADKEKI